MGDGLPGDGFAVGVGFPVGDFVGDGVAVGVGLGEGIGAGEGVGVGVTVGVGLGVGVGVGVTLGATFTVNDVSADLSSTSTTRTVTALSPTFAGVPEIAPLSGSIETPSGRPVAEKLSGAVPPATTGVTSMESPSSIETSARAPIDGGSLGSTGFAQVTWMLVRDPGHVAGTLSAAYHCDVLRCLSLHRRANPTLLQGHLKPRAQGALK